MDLSIKKSIDDLKTIEIELYYENEEPIEPKELLITTVEVAV